MGRLVYHDQSGISEQSSPFDEALLEVAKSGSVDIVSPYIGVDYLQRIIGVTNDWRLISDIEAWLSSLSIRARPNAWIFIRENLERIHHCRAIHAKAVISKRLAMLGSANLTKTGILERTEMGILIDEPMLVVELGVWFDSLWQQTLPPIADETNAFVQWLDEVSAQIPPRRDKFTLSASGQKIRAKLVKLPAQPKQQDDSPLNLDGLAQTLVLQDLQHYESLEEAIEAAINTLANEEFSLGRFVAVVRKAFSTISIREIYFGLVQHCANHVRSVFAESTRNRLILDNGRFTQSTKEMIPKALAPFDLFLTVLIHHCGFDQARDLPDEDLIKEQTGINGEGQILLISDLIDCGFLDLEDVAGSLPKYKLVEDFEWTGRYRLFERAMHDWMAKKSHYVRISETSTPETDVPESDNQYSDTSIVYGKNKSKPTPAAELKDNLFLKNFSSQITNRMDNLREAKKNRYQTQLDKVLSIILARLLSGERLNATSDLAFQLSSKTGMNKNLVMSLISGEVLDLPKVIVFDNASIAVHPDPNWKELTDYPLTQRVCREFPNT